MHRKALAVCTMVFMMGSLAAAAPQVGAWQALERDYPGVRAYTAGDLVLSVYGRAMTTGATSGASAERFRLENARVFGISSEDLQAGFINDKTRMVQPVSFDAATGQYRFSLHYYSQVVDGIPVFRGELRLLVRNEPTFPLVLAKSSIRALGDFDVAARSAAKDKEQALNTVKREAPHLNQVTDHGLVVWAGIDEKQADPALAYVIHAENDHPHRWLYLVDAVTGEILYSENRIVHVDVDGTVTGNATRDPVAEDCSSDLRQIMPYARVNIGATSVYADENGAFTIPNAGATDVTVQSPVRGQWFRVFNNAGADTVLSQTVTPPGPADFTHNDPGSEFLRGEINGYVGSNIVRDYVLFYNPAFPTLGATESPVYVNRNDGFCPGNAWWDPADLSINFCRASGNSPNTAFGSVVYHEYGHHLVNAAGSGQGQYGEGFGDVMSVIIADDPGLGYGFTGSCSSPLRTAENNLQYPCTAGSHACAGLLSGPVWKTRNELFATDPGNYLDIISDLAVNSVLLHTGSSITPQVTIDFLTLDDDDSDLDNGTPHWNEICAGFGAHNLDCPELVFLEFTYPDGLPELVAPGAETNIRVNVQPNVVDPIEATGTVHYRVGTAGSFTSVPMAELAPNEYEATLPAVSCGESIEFYFGATADSSGGIPVTDPVDSPTTIFSSLSATAVVEVASYDFEDATGWTVSGNATDGQWGAGVPANGNRGDPPSDYDGSGSCFLTDNVAGNSDVDGGTTILTSPSFDLSAMPDARVSYARWYSNIEGDSPQADTFFIRASNDSNSYVTMETVGPSGIEVAGGWFFRSFKVADTVAVSSDVRFRFDVGDLGSGSIVEAALDQFEVINVVCGVEVPTEPPAPHNVRKNRYLSFEPNNADGPTAFEVAMVAGPGATGVLGWVGEPDADGVSRVVTDPFFGDSWPAVVQVGDCEIVPVASYTIRATKDQVGFSAPLTVDTIAQPGLSLYGDCVGDFDEGLAEWSGPQGVVNFNDVSAAVLGFQDAVTAPHRTWVDIGDEVPNYIINFNDISLIVKGFQGDAYPPPAWTALTPADCP